MADGTPGPRIGGTSAGPVDPDVDLHDPGHRREMRRGGAAVVAVIAAGGVLGAAARHGVGVALPTTATALPWSTLTVNASGSLLIGVLMVLVVEARQGHRLLRPFVGVGVIGGYTTFSTYAVEAQTLVAAGRPAVALGYLAGTVVVALLSVQLGAVLTRGVVLRRPRARTRRDRTGEDGR